MGDFGSYEIGWTHRRFFIEVLYQVEEVPSISSFLTVFVWNEGGFYENISTVSTEMPIWYFFFFNW